MTLDNKPDRSIPAWTWGLATVIAIGAVVLLVIINRPPEPPHSFRYDVTRYERIDPSLILFEEQAPITPDVPGLAAIATTPEGRIYVAGANTVVIYGLDGRGIARHPVNGAPTCLAVAADGDILVGMNSHVEVLSADGKLKKTWPSRDGAHFTSITARGDEVFVADAGKRVVIAYDREGNAIREIGKEDSAKGILGFVVPSPCFDVAFDNMGALWAVNPGRHGLECYRSDGTLVTAWYRTSIEAEGFSGCCNPTHIAFRSDGSLVTAEKGLARVKIYSVDQKLIGFVADPAIFNDSLAGALSCELETPLNDLAVDAEDRVLVLDTHAKTIRVFKKKATP